MALQAKEKQAAEESIMLRRNAGTISMCWQNITGKAWHEQIGCVLRCSAPRFNAALRERCAYIAKRLHLGMANLKART
jgi:hypothetical protein